jgi:hypothetical protein
MLLTLSTTHRPATDLGFLLHKHPDRAQQVSLSFGTAHLFYPEADNQRCTFALLLEVDPVALVRGRSISTSTIGPTSGPPSSALPCLGPWARRSVGAALTGRTSRRQTCRWKFGLSRCPAAAAPTSSAGCSNRSATKSGPSRCPWIRTIPNGGLAACTP